MATWFISRHEGAIEWMQQQSISVDYWATHLDLEAIQPGDIIIGILPIAIAAEVIAFGARYFALILPQQASDRGQEHSSEAMKARGAYLQEFLVTSVNREVL